MTAPLAEKPQLARPTTVRAWNCLSRESGGSIGGEADPAVG